MFALRRVSDKALHTMKNGQPFLYSSKELAHRAKVLLEGNLRIRLTVVPV